MKILILATLLMVALLVGTPAFAHYEDFSAILKDCVVVTPPNTVAGETIYENPRGERFVYWASEKELAPKKDFYETSKGERFEYQTRPSNGRKYAALARLYPDGKYRYIHGKEHYSTKEKIGKAASKVGSVAAGALNAYVIGTSTPVYIVNPVSTPTPVVIESSR